MKCQAGRMSLTFFCCSVLGVCLLNEYMKVPEDFFVSDEKLFFLKFMLSKLVTSTLFLHSRKERGSVKKKLCLIKNFKQTRISELKTNNG